MGVTLVQFSAGTPTLALPSRGREEPRVIPGGRRPGRGSTIKRNAMDSLPLRFAPAGNDIALQFITAPRIV